ncbi:MAG TPA: pteridine reductase [Steroidobacteraceae bacterium]|jgi:pteridine reductase|nr:pteridine reductase [Steroidobacteraceae bacterium]
MSDGSLTGKTVLITGGARRVGAEVARLLHAAGANLVIHYRRSSREAAALAGELNAARGRSAAIVAGELLDIDELPSLVEFAVRSFGALDVLINNASTFYPTKIGEITPAAWDDLLGTNLKVPTFLSQAAAPALRQSRGLILNIVDIHALRPLRDHTVYCTAKAGLHMLTRSLAKELGPEIRVNGIAPGPILWPSADTGDESKRAKIIERTILKRMGSPADIARTALFFAAQAPYITGQILAVDGGRSVAW